MTGQTIHAVRAARWSFVAAAASVGMACSRAPEAASTSLATRDTSTAVTYVVHDTTIESEFDAAGSASAVQLATLSTKLMGTITDVLVREGDRVHAGEALARIDARDLSAKSAQVEASIGEAEAMRKDALVQANRIRALYADSAATRAQLDAAETGLARAEAAVKAAHAAESELGAMTTYSVIRAPFDGMITRRFVDPGAFATPGAPILTVQDVSTLRISAAVTPDIARQVRRGQSVSAAIEGAPVRAIVEGVVPSASSANLSMINALVSNSGNTLLPGSAATLTIGTGRRAAIVVPTAAIVREGDLTGVTLRTGQGDDRRWVRLGRTTGDMVEVTSGLRAGDRVVLPSNRTVASVGG